MPFQPINFANIEPQGNPGLRDFVANLAKGYQIGQLPQQLARQAEQERLANAMKSLLLLEQPQKFGEESQGRQLKNALSQYKVQEEPQRFSSEMSTADIARAFQKAQANKLNTMTPLEAQELAQKNALYPELTRSQIANNLALSKQRELGITGLNAGGKEEYYYKNSIAQSNPEFTKEQIFEAANAVREGRDTLSDGKKINITPDMVASLDRATKYTTTSPLITGNIKGAQAEAEIGALAKHAQSGLKEYGKTYAGYSPQQIIDTFKTDKKSQERLGKFIAAKQLQYEIAQNQIKLANGQPGVTSTQELMDLGMQNIKAAYPVLSQEARETAQNYFIEGLKKGFEARKKVRLGASGAFNPSRETQTSNNNDPLGLR